MLSNQPCTCASGRTYEECCFPFHEGSVFPPTALQLMRSRYSAYTRGHTDYLVKTVVKSRQVDHQPKGIEQFARSADWKRLDILDVEAGESGDERGVVEFQAWYLQHGKLECIRERSLFFIEEGIWKYSHGSHAKPQIGRNDPCPCGSGKKYKKCHG